MAVYIILEIWNNISNHKILNISGHTETESLPLQKTRFILLVLSVMALIFGGFIVSIIARFPIFPNILTPVFLLAALPFPYFISQYKQLKRAENPASSNKPKQPSSTDEKVTSDTQTLFEAILKNDPETLQAELTKGIDINTPYPANGNTPLHIAAWNGYMEQAKILLAQPNINKEAKNHSGKTPLDLAKEQGLSDMISLLETKGDTETQEYSK